MSSYLFQKAGIFYYQRLVPMDLQSHYRRKMLSFSLRTRSHKQALRKAVEYSAKLEAQWTAFRALYNDPFSGFLRESMSHSISRVGNQDTAGRSFAEAAEYYLLHKGKNRGDTFKKAVERACRYLFKATKNKPLAHYSRSDAVTFRDFLLNKGLASSSITRVLTTVKAVYNFAVSEWGLEIQSPFTGLYLDRDSGVKKRVPIAIGDIRRIQQSCYKLDDDLRWAVAMISDTGARLAEIIGASVQDLDLDSDKAPTLHIRPHNWRSLKTLSSNRTVPLIGAALWGARRAASNAQDAFLFPRYNKADLTNTNSASAALSKWIKAEGRTDYTMHSFRHSFRDRLRAVECPHDVIDQLGGWSRQSVGESYGQGYDMNILAKWMREIEL